MAVVSLLFALGPILKVNDLETSIKLPYNFLYNLHFVFRSIRVISRIWVLLSLPLSLLLLSFMEAINHERSQRIVKYASLIAIASLIVFDTHTPHKLENHSDVYKLTYIYRVIEQAPGAVLLELPSGMSHRNLKGIGVGQVQDDGYYQFMHIYHDKWTVNGDSGYAPRDSMDIIRRIDRAYDDRSELQRLFQSDHISLVLIHRKRIQDDYLLNYRKFIKNLRHFGRIIHIDQTYVLVSIDFKDSSSEKDPRTAFF